MANLRETRKRMDELGLTWIKTDTVEDMLPQIAGSECGIEETVKTELELDEAKVEAEQAELKKTREPAPAMPKGLGKPKPASQDLDGSSETVAGLLASTEGMTISGLIDGLTITEADLTTDFMKQPALHARVVVLAATANGKMLSAKSRRRVVEGELYKKHKEKLIEGGIAKPTEKAIGAEVDTDPAWIASEDYYASTTEAYGLFKGLCKSYEDRKDMLVQMGAGQRQEKDQTGFSMHGKAMDVIGKKTA